MKRADAWQKAPQCVKQRNTRFVFAFSRVFSTRRRAGRHSFVTHCIFIAYSVYLQV